MLLGDKVINESHVLKYTRVTLLVCLYSRDIIAVILIELFRRNEEFYAVFICSSFIETFPLCKIW